MSSMRVFAAVLLVAGAALAEDKKADDKAGKAELKKLEGTWKGTAGSIGGKELKPGDVGMDTAEIKGTRLTFRLKDREVASFKITIRPAKKPKHMDWIKDKKSIPLPCIYELKGDELKICFPMLPVKGAKVKLEIKRPEKFETKDGPFGLIVMKRQKS